MATTIRLARHGAKKHPVYRIIVADSRAPRDGRRLDQIGTYDPSEQPARVQINAEKLALWTRRGARPSLEVPETAEEQA
jgi:small subunit ribosomal protein S16